MWLRVLADKKEWKRMFMDDRIFVNQVCVQAIHFAMKNGFLELTEYLWRKLTPPQKEAIGFLAWKSVCIRLNCTEILRFLCDQLCEINLNGMVILTWDSFYAKVIKSLEVSICCIRYVIYRRKIETPMNTSRTWVNSNCSYQISVQN